MLTLLLGTDWTANRNAILQRIAEDVKLKKEGRILIVPELISHDTERKLCDAAGDTASRYAEVLTFTRLAKRVADSVGFGATECLDNGGRLVAMASAARQLYSKLKAYASVETRPEFLAGLVDAVDEFKRCCISSDDLMLASKYTEGSFAQKLEELALLLDAYDSLCARGKRDPRDQMTWLLEQLEDFDFASRHVFYVEGFPDFTRQHMNILEYLIENSSNVTVSLTCDMVNSVSPAFEKAGHTAGLILELARQANVSIEMIHVPGQSYELRKILPALFHGTIQVDKSLAKQFHLYHTESLYQECHGAAEEIIRLLKDGCRFRDISVVCCDMNAYLNTINMVFSRYHIPVYQSGSDNILDKTVISTVLSAIDAAVSGFEQTDVLHYLKSALSPLTMEACDALENYVFLWSISGSQWFGDWDYHPGGLGMDWTDADRIYLKELKSYRDVALLPLQRLSKAMFASETLSNQIQALYFFLDELELDSRLMSFAEQMNQKGNLRAGQILEQLWEILLTALEQLYDMLGDTKWDCQTFSRLLRLLLSQYDVGSIPSVLDAVTVGGISAMCYQQPKHLIILGASEGSFPSYSGTSGVLTDQERIMLRRLGVPLTGGAVDGLQIEFSEIYNIFNGVTNSVNVFCSDGQPSFLYRRLRDMVGGAQRYVPMGFSSADPAETAAFLVRNNAEEEANKLGLKQPFHQIRRRVDRKLGYIEQETIRKLYGHQLRLSASQIDKLAECRLAYFLKYGLRLKERKAITVDPAEYGTYVHAVLEKTGRDVMAKGGFHCVSFEETLEIADHYSEQYFLERFDQLDSQRISYLFRRNVQELKLVVKELWEELNESDFEPFAFELAFGDGGNLDAITFHGKQMSASLRGFVDRVDIWRRASRVYYRVVDYKTGKKDFDYCDIYNGLGLQMLLYLFALEADEQNLLQGDPKPAGVQYFPARVPVISVDGFTDTDSAAGEREKLWKRKGLLLADEDVLKAMENTEKPKRLSYTVKKDGSISGDLADREQLRLLKGYIYSLLGKMIDDISSGCVEPNPYTRGMRHNACAFCPYGLICHPKNVSGRRDYASMSASEFWERVGKEMNGYG